MMGDRTMPLSRRRNETLYVLSIDIVVTIKRIPSPLTPRPILISICFDAKWGNSLEINGCRNKIGEVYNFAFCFCQVESNDPATAVAFSLS